MEEMMMVMMNITTHEQTSSHHHHNNLNNPISNPTWKLYENPFYNSHHKPHEHQHHSTVNHKQIHRLNLPIPTRKLAASFWDLKFINPFMESELEMARLQINELKSELEFEQKTRKKMESLNKRLSNQLCEERKMRKAMDHVCHELAKNISFDKSTINRMKNEIEQERKMSHIAEVIRENGVQMKLAEAKMLLEEKFSELEMVKKMGFNIEKSSSNDKKDENDHRPLDDVDSTAVMKRGYREIENPHIRRGIKGFVEFPRVIRAMGCRSGKHLGSKLECQKAQLKLLLKQKGPVRCNDIIIN